MSTVLVPRGQVQVLHWGKLDVIKSVGFSKGIQMTEGIKRIAAGRQAVVVLLLLCDLGEQELLSTQLPIAYLNDISQNHTGFWCLLQEKPQGSRISRVTKKLKSRPRAMILSSLQSFPLKPEQLRATMTASDLVYSTVYTAHRTGWGHFLHLKILLNFSSWKTNYCVQSREQGEEAVWDNTMSRSAFDALGYLRHAPLSFTHFTNPARVGGRLKLKGRNNFDLNHILCWEADDAEASEDGKVPMPTPGIALWDPTLCVLHRLVL